MSGRLARTERSQLRPILVVDDDDSVRELLIELLELEESHPVIAARSGWEALEVLRSRVGLPCVVVTDLMMPGMSGWDLLEAMKAEPAFAAIPSIVVSASLFHGFGPCEKPSAHTRFLPKPICPDDLVGAIASLCSCAKSTGVRRVSQIA